MDQFPGPGWIPSNPIGFGGPSGETELIRGRLCQVGGMEGIKRINPRRSGVWFVCWCFFMWLTFELGMLHHRFSQWNLKDLKVHWMWHTSFSKPMFGVVGFVHIELFSSMWRQDPFQTDRTDQTRSSWYLYPVIWKRMETLKSHLDVIFITSLNLLKARKIGRISSETRSVLMAVVFSITGSDAELVFGDPTGIQFENPPQACSRILRQGLVEDLHILGDHLHPFTGCLTLRGWGCSLIQSVVEYTLRFGSTSESWGGYFVFGFLLLLTHGCDSKV